MAGGWIGSDSSGKSLDVAVRWGTAALLVLPACAVVQAVTTAPATAGGCHVSSGGCEQPLEVDVSATGGYTVTYPWSIEKEVDRTWVEVDAATGEATFTYTVTVRAGAPQPAAWVMGGTIEVANPNEHDGGDITLTGADVVTDVGGGAVCTTTLPDDPVVPAASGGQDGTLMVPFTCTFTGSPATSGSVDATVTWNPADASEDGTAGDSGPATLSVTQEIDRTVDVVDDKTNPASPVLLEQDLEWSAGLVKTYEYSLTLPGAVGECVDHTNTATVDLSGGAGPTDSVTTTVCVPVVVTTPPPAPPVVVTPPAPVVVTPPVPPAPPEVLPAAAFGKAVGSVRTTCQGTVRANLKNRSGAKVTYRLRVGKKVHRIGVRSLVNKKFRTHGKPRARVTLKLGGRVLDRVRIPGPCARPELLPATGLRAAQVRARIAHQASSTRGH